MTMPRLASIDSLPSTAIAVLLRLDPQQAEFVVGAARVIGYGLFVSTRRAVLRMMSWRDLAEV